MTNAKASKDCLKVGVFIKSNKQLSLFNLNTMIGFLLESEKPKGRISYLTMISHYQGRTGIARGAIRVRPG